MRAEPPLIRVERGQEWPACMRCGELPAHYQVGVLEWCEACWLKSQLEQADAEVERLRAEVATLTADRDHAGTGPTT